MGGAGQEGLENHHFKCPEQHVAAAVLTGLSHRFYATPEDYLVKQSISLDARQRVWLAMIQRNSTVAQIERPLWKLFVENRARRSHSLSRWEEQPRLGAVYFRGSPP